MVNQNLLYHIVRDTKNRSVAEATVRHGQPGAGCVFLLAEANCALLGVLFLLLLFATGRGFGESVQDTAKRTLSPCCLLWFLGL